MSITPETLTVAQLGERGVAGLRLLHAGARHHSPVGVPYAVEFRDPRPWLSGGELVLTTGSLLHDDWKAWQDFFAGLAEAGACAVVVSTGSDRPLVSLPTELVDLAQAAGLTLFGAPAGASLTSISRDVTAARISAERTVLQESFDLQMTLTGVVARGGNLDDLVQGWHRATGETVCVLDRVGRTLARSAGVDPDVLAILRQEVQDDPPGLTGSRQLSGREDVNLPEGLELRSFSGGSSVRGYLARGSSGSQVTDLAVPALLSLLALEFERRWFLDEPTRRKRAQYVTRLLSSSEEGRNRALLHSLGVDAMELWGVAVEARNETHAEVLVDDLALLLPTQLMRQEGRIVECLAVQDPRETLERLGLGVPLGIGTPVPPAQASRTMRQAHSALETSRRAGAIISFVDGSAHDFLLNVADPAYLRSFADAVLAPLDSAPQGEVLLQTLHTWLLENRSLDTTAERLAVHRHTVRNRVQRIMQLTGHSLDSVDVQTELWLALKARGIGQD